jgi:hypothetical protein
MSNLYKVNYTSNDGSIIEHEFLTENIVTARRHAEKFGKSLNKYTDKRNRVCGYTISESK